jgi:hypothetical protein
MADMTITMRNLKRQFRFLNTMFERSKQQSLNLEKVRREAQSGVLNVEDSPQGGAPSVSRSYGP